MSLPTTLNAPAALAAPPGQTPALADLRSQIAALVQQYANMAHAPQPFVPGETVVPVSGTRS